MLLGWKQIPGFSNYEISENGDLRASMLKDHSGKVGGRKKPGVLLKPTLAATGYLIVTITHDDGKIKYTSINRLVALAFYGEPPTPKHQALHWDDVRSNNHYKNIRWGTCKDNAADCVRNGHRPSGSKNNLAKLTPSQVRQMRKLHSQGYT